MKFLCTVGVSALYAVLACAFMIDGHTVHAICEFGLAALHLTTARAGALLKSGAGRMKVIKANNRLEMLELENAILKQLLADAILANHKLSNSSQER